MIGLSYVMARSAIARRDGPLSRARISYLFLSVCNLETMLEFYCERLGFSITHVQPNHCAFLRLKGSRLPQLALFAGREAVASTNPHWFFAVDVADIAEVASEIKKRGVKVGPIEEVPQGRAAKFADPDGNVIELHEPDRRHRTGVKASR